MRRTLNTLACLTALLTACGPELDDADAPVLDQHAQALESDGLITGHHVAGTPLATLSVVVNGTGQALTVHGTDSNDKMTLSRINGQLYLWIVIRDSDGVLTGSQGMVCTEDGPYRCDLLVTHLNIFMGDGDDEFSTTVPNSEPVQNNGLHWLRVSGEDGNDTIEGASWAHGGGDHDTITGTSGDDLLQGGTGHDALYALGGDDDVYGQEGDDVIEGGGGEDAISGGDGNDTLSGGDDDDLIFGDADDDDISGGNGADEIHGGGGRDTLRGDAGGDTIYGDDGADVIYGGEGKDSLHGNDGGDTIYGQQDDDRIFGGGGDDDLYGGSGKDNINGGGGRDHADGEAGDDDCSAEKKKNC
ncbi:MAG: hypothetical protein KC583_20690 [Myxococcales bacterium]|nr:hypothetical protein [Myxococcales bacterium]